MPTPGAALAIWAALIAAAAVDAKIYGRCELAGKLARAGLDGFGGVGVGDWLCLAHSASGFDTASVGRNPEGSSDYGIFQLSSAWRCNDGVTPTRDLCRLSCNDLLNRHLLDDIACTKKVVTLHGGPGSLGHLAPLLQRSRPLLVAPWLRPECETRRPRSGRPLTLTLL